MRLTHAPTDIEPFSAAKHAAAQHVNTTHARAIAVMPPWGGIALANGVRRGGRLRNQTPPTRKPGSLLLT